MSAISYCEEAFALLRASLAEENALIQTELTAIVMELNALPVEPTQADLDQIRAHASQINALLAAQAVLFEPTPDQVKAMGAPKHFPMPKPAWPEPKPPVVHAPAPAKGKK